MVGEKNLFFDSLSRGTAGTLKMTTVSLSQLLGTAEPGNHTYMLTYIHTYTHTYTHTHIHTHTLTHVHTYIHTYTHTYTHTYIHT